MTAFLAPSDTGLFWTTEFYRFTPDTSKFMVIPQAWSLSLELVFYVLAPFIVRRNVKAVAAIIGASLALRFALYDAGLRVDPWSYRFFPFELALFLAGSLAYHMYASIRPMALPPVAKIFGWSALVPVLLFPFMDGGGLTFLEPARFGLYLYLVLALPFLFKHTSRMAFDRLAGDLSYPVYLGHMIFIQLVQGISPLAAVPIVRTVIAIGGSVGFAFIVARGIEAPVDRFRQSRLRAHVAATS